MTRRLCAWCNRVEGSNTIGVVAGDPLTHTICRLCLFEHFVLGLMTKGYSRLRRLLYR